MYYSSIPEISVEELALRLADRDDSLQLIDVREVDEVEIASLPGFQVLPLSQFARWEKSIMTQFAPETETIVLCHHGMRSGQMCQWLIERGFINVKNVTGGIDAYSRAIDSSIPRY